MTDRIPDLVSVTAAGNAAQFFPRWTYQKIEQDDGTFDFGASSGVDAFGYRRMDNITDEILTYYRAAIGDQASKDDIFYYVYGLLHEPEYREQYAADLKKMLPRIPTRATRDRFMPLVDAGRKLADLHVD
jgi:predicted helicase